MTTTEETMTMNIEELQKVFKSHDLDLEIVSSNQIAWRDEHANALRVRVYLNQQHLLELHSECRSIGYAAEQIEHLISDTKEEIEEAQGSVFNPFYEIDKPREDVKACYKNRQLAQKFEVRVSSLGDISLVNLETRCAIDAFVEEFDYYACEAPESFQNLAQELFTEELGETEADKIDWPTITKHFLSKEGNQNV